MSWDDEPVVGDIEGAGRIISDTVSRDLRSASCDLLDSLDSARFSSQPYSTPPKEWPPYVDIVNARELPPVLIERYNASGGQGTALCGIFPAIRRCWATVDNTLFLWRFDRWDGQCPEYSGEEQAICAVGFGKAKPSVFVEALQHVIILATPVELVLLGVCCSASNDGSDPFSELSIQPLPDYTIPTDGVTMTCVTTTNSGRIFLGGRDGHIYELVYTNGMGWQKRCRKVCHTGGVSSFLSRWVVPNALKFGAVDSVVEIVVDEERHILYARTQESKLQVYDMGKHGDSALKKVAEESRIGDQRDSRYNGSRGVGGRSGARVPKTNIVALAPLTAVESKYLHLVAITSDGRRLFISTTPNQSGANVSGGGLDRPTVLRVVTTRPAPPFGVAGGAFASLPIGPRNPAEGGVLKVEAAYLSSGLLLLSDSSPQTLSRLLVSMKDLTNPLQSSNLGLAASGARSLRALRETVTVLGVEGRTLAIADVLPPSERLVALEASIWETSHVPSLTLDESDEFTRAKRLWARGELATQHVLPRRRAVIISTMGQMEVVLNRPVDLLQRLFESNTFRPALEEFFQRFGEGEGAAMCLLLAARLTVDEESLVPPAVAEKAAEAFDDPRLVGSPQVRGAGVGTVNSTTGGFNMGQVVQEAEPVFSGAHEGLCLCAARLLSSIWELPVMVVKGGASAAEGDGVGVIACRLPMDALQVLEGKVRSLEQFFRSRKGQRRVQYGRVSGLTDFRSYPDNGFSAYGGDPYSRADLNGGVFDTPMRNGTERGGHVGPNKRQRLPYTQAELVAMEARSMESIRRLLRRSGEALLLLQLLSQHHIARLAQRLDPATRQQLSQLTFHQFVCSRDGEQTATRLVAGLMEYYVAPDGRGTVDDISLKLREGCSSYYNESDYQFYQAVECLERAAGTRDIEERERLAREALIMLEKVPETADLLSICQRFEDIRFYEAVVELPLRKARALDPAEDAFNEHIDASRQQEALAARIRCYDVVTNALRSLKGLSGQNGLRAEFGSPIPAGARSSMDDSTRDHYIRQIIQLGVRWPDRAFHEHLYQAMIDLGLVKELLEMAGPDLVPFLQSAGSSHAAKKFSGPNSSGLTSLQGPDTHLRQQITGEQAKYLELLSRYYVHKRQHAYAAHVLLRLAEMRQPEGAERITLEQRFDYLSNAVLQARSVGHGSGTVPSSPDIGQSSLLELLEGKLAVLRFQIKIRDELERIASRSGMENAMESEPSTSQTEAFPSQAAMLGVVRARTAKDKAGELGFELKSITHLYNDYAVPFELWEVCLEILHFSNYAGDADNSHMRATWTRLLEQALNVGGIAEACAVVRRVGLLLYPGDGGSIPLDAICHFLEPATEERVSSKVEEVGDEDIPRALLVACKGDPEPVQRTYDRFLASVPLQPKLRLRILRSLLAVLFEWTVSALGQKVVGGSGAFLYANGLEYEGAETGLRDKLSTLANRYMTEVRRLPLPPAAVEDVSRGFKELEQMLQSSSFQ